MHQAARDRHSCREYQTLTTHKIEPEVDGARWYLMQNMFYSQSLLRYAFAKGVNAATPENPRVNYTGDPYWTDGLRLVMWLSGDADQLSEGRIGATRTSATLRVQGFPSQTRRRTVGCGCADMGI
jgi:LssY C-terminus